MTTDLLTAARAVRADFLPAEQTTDLAAAQTARLLATILEQRAATGVAIATGAPLIRKLSKSLTAQIEAREEFIMAHKLAAALQGQLGMTPTQFGDVDECPPDDPEVRRSRNELGDHSDTSDGNKIVRLIAA